MAKNSERSSSIEDSFQDFVDLLDRGPIGGRPGAVESYFEMIYDGLHELADVNREAFVSNAETQGMIAKALERVAESNLKIAEAIKGLRVLK